jgi:hypothetical protein
LIKFLIAVTAMTVLSSTNLVVAQNSATERVDISKEWVLYEAEDEFGGKRIVKLTMPPTTVSVAGGAPQPGVVALVVDTNKKLILGICLHKNGKFEKMDHNSGPLASAHFRSRVIVGEKKGYKNFKFQKLSSKYHSPESFLEFDEMDVKSLSFHLEKGRDVACVLNGHSPNHRLDKRKMEALIVNGIPYTAEQIGRDGFKVTFTIPSKGLWNPKKLKGELPFPVPGLVKGYRLP